MRPPKLGLADVEGCMPFQIENVDSLALDSAGDSSADPRHEKAPFPEPFVL